MGYEYDVFLSYHRGERFDADGKQVLSASGHWVRSLFLPLLREWLPQQMGHARIACDDDIPIGAGWREELERRHRASKCLVAVLSGPYFRSGPCISEWNSMIQRHRLLERGGARGVRVVHQIRFGDGTCFDDHARELQWEDYEEYNRIRLRSDPRHRRLVDAVYGTTKKIETMIRAAPAWRSDFPWSWHDDIALTNEVPESLR